MSQVARVKALLQERALAFDATLDVSEGSAYYRGVIAPVLAAISPDTVDTDALEFIRARIRQEYPSVPTNDADGIIALMAKPLAMVLEPFKADLENVRIGQSTRNAKSMTATQAQDLAANWLVRPKAGGRSQTTVRVYYASPRTVSVQRTSILSTPSGLNFLPMQAQTIRIESMLVQREGTEYYIDIPVIAEREGAEYDVDAGSITQSAAFSAATRITNRVKARGGRGGESSEALLQRVETSVTERSLTTGRGIVARLNDVFGGLIRDVVPVGAGDPEMQRDVLTGRGEGSLLASGICFVVGEYCLLASQFEDRGADGRRAPVVGDEIELNYWSFLYDAPPAQRNETFEIIDILFDTRDAIPSLPSVMLFRMSGAPSVASPAAATVPGTHPGVFAAVRGRGVLEISGVPGGITQPTTSRGTLLVEDNQVHVFGHQDVWLRPASTAQGAATMQVYPGTPLKEGENLATTLNEGGRSQVTFDTHATVSMTAGTLQVGDRLGVGYVTAVDGDRITFTRDGPSGEAPAPGGSFSTEGGAAGTFITVEIDGLAGTELDGAIAAGAGYVLEILSGADKGTYKIIAYFSEFLALDKELTQPMSGVSYRICRTADVDLFRPTKPVLPFASKAAVGLRTAIGSPIVRVNENIQDAGGDVGDTLEILSGPDAGAYSIIEFDSVGGGTAPVLSVAMSSTNSGLAYRVYRSGQGAQTPLVRVVPRGVRLLDAANQDSGLTIPYALPLSARPPNGLSGAQETGRGVCGFVLPDPGTSWAPASNRSIPTGCYTTGCDACVDGAVVIISITELGEMYLDADIPGDAASFFADLRQWFLDIISSFGMGATATAFVQGLTPIRLGPPPGTATVVAAYEFCLPQELWDSRTNVFIALPDIDWEAEAARAGSFDAALTRFNLGLLEGGFRPSIVASAVPGDTLTLESGANAGSYLIERVTILRVACPGSIVSGEYVEARTYPVTIVVVRDEFPASPRAGLSTFFAGGVAPLVVPSVPTLPYVVYDMSGTLVPPWALISSMSQFILQWASALGFDIPSGVVLDEQSTLQALWQRLFVSYTVGHPTSPQTVRLRFLEPTSVTVFPPRRLVGTLSLTTLNGESPTVTGAAHGLALPHGALTGKAYAIYVRTPISRVIVAGTLPVAAGTAANDNALAEVLTDEFTTRLDDLGIRDWSIRVDVAGLGALRVLVDAASEQLLRNADTYIELDVQDPAGAFATLGFSGSNQGQGTTNAPAGSFAIIPRPHPTTKLYAASGGSRLEFCPTPGLEWVYYPPTPPGDAPAVDRLPRDLSPTAPPTGERVASFWLSRLFEPSLQSRPCAVGDTLRVYPQRRPLDLAVPEGPAFQVRDRMPGVTLTAGSPILRLPATAVPQFTFTAPQGGDDANAVRVGDLVFIEEGAAAGGYRVIERYSDRLVLDRPVVESTPKILANGNTGSIDLADPKAVRIPAGMFRDAQDAVGNYLTIWSAHHVDISGSYEVTNSQNDGTTLLLTLDTPDDFPAPEVGLHWALTRAIDAPLTPAATSLTDGRTELGAVRPIRIYSGTPADCTVLLGEATSSLVTRITVELPEGGIPESVRPPYCFVREGAYHIASSRMREQGRDRGLYWFDVPVISLGHTDAHNLAPEARMDPVFGTYISDGYWFDVSDTAHTFSSKEDTRIVFSGDFLPDTEEDLFGNRRSPVGRSVTITYDFAPVVDQVQALLSSTTERNTCADSLARHFCPSYVYLDLAVSGGPAPAVMASKLFQRIEALSAVDPLDVSVLERDLQGAGSYDHPIFLQVVTHDLDRRLVESRSLSRIDDETLDANATTRTTYFIPGPDRSTLPEDQVPDGERIFIQRGTGRVL